MKINRALAVLLALFCISAFLGITIISASPTIQSGWENSNQGTDATDGGIWNLIGTPGVTPIVVTSPVHTGSYACKFSGTPETYVYNTSTPTQSVTIIAYIYFETLPSPGHKVQCEFIRGSDQNNEVLAGVQNDNGIVTWDYVDNAAVYTSTVLASTGVWYKVQLEGDIVGGQLIYSIWITDTNTNHGVQIANSQVDGQYHNFDLLDQCGVGLHGQSESVTNYVDDVTIISNPLVMFSLPEYAFGGLIAIASCLAAFIVFNWKKDTPKTKLQ